ncbi:MAG: glucose-1-phosphate adenylyltransferase [Alphaproteobacteria bacterium]|jgi:glucose-1-phosphate adenylyltransferase|nr:glucose-1-phosphate adenylyltransferase [Alphaproteobacteria bacterium]
MSDPTAFHTDLPKALKHTMALVLAGGRGTRLMNLTDHEAKPAIPFGGKYRIVDFPLSNCLNSGIRKISVLTQYKGHTLIHHIQRGWSFLRAELGEFIELWPATQQMGDESWYIGTADAVFQNLRNIEEYAPEYILVLAGDHVYKQDYGQMLADHIENGAECTVACVQVPRMDATAFGVIHVDERNWITSFLEKPKDPPCVPGMPDVAYASMGIYIFDSKFLIDQLRAEREIDHTSHDFGKDVLPRIVDHHKVYAHDFGRSAVKMPGSEKPYWRDVGTLDAYWEANMDLVSVNPELDLYDEEWQIFTYQAQRPSAKFVFDDEDRRGEAIDSCVSAGCIVSGGVVRHSFLYSGVRVNSYTKVTDSVILPDTDIGRHCRLHRVIVDSRCRIPPGTIIGEDAEADAKRFHRSEKGITLVTQEMLDKL